MPAPLFSIIIPTYNSAATLSACLESIINQHYNNWEVLLMDGLSKDDTLLIASSFTGKFPVKIISQKDKGIYDAMNSGIASATGEWLYFLGSDDKFFDKDVLTNIAKAINDSPEIDVIYGNVFSERFNGLYDGEFDAEKILTRNISHQAIFFKKAIFSKTGFFDLRYKAQSDWDHNFKWLLSKDIEKKFVPVTVAHYADGGFSSLHGDTVFFADLNFNYIRYGVSSIPAAKKRKLLLYELLKSVKRMEVIRFKKVLSHIKYI